MTAARSALVVGAGIAGMTAAGELARSGIEVDLIEREPEPVFRGIGILLLAPAVRSMEMLGLADACLERGFPQVDASTFLADGTLLARTPMRGLASDHLPPAIGIARSAFGSVLRERADEAGVRLRCGLTVQAIDGDVDVLFSDGSSGHYDVVVGADGLRSTVRALCFGEQPAPYHIGQSVWRVLVGSRPAEVNGQMLFLAGQTRAGVNAILPDDMYLYCVHPTSEGDRPLDGAASYALLMSLLEEYGGLIGDVRRQLTPDRPLHYGPLYTSFVEGAWHRGGVVLIGDAAHATPPHLASGAGIAIEDAIVLARCLHERDDVPSAFADFMDRRYERCRMVIENSRTLARWDLDPDAPGGEAAKLMTDTWVELSKPI